MAINKDKVLELVRRCWNIAHKEGRTGEVLSEEANEVLSELRDALDAGDGDVFTGQLVEIDGHTYGLRPGAARVVKDASRDAGRTPLTRSQIAKASADAQVAFCLDKQPTYEVALAREVERAHGIAPKLPRPAIAKDGA